MIKTAEINQRLLDDLPVVRLPKFVPPGGGLSIWWMGDDKITFQATSADTASAYAFWVDEPPGHVGPPKHVHSREEEGFYVIEGQVEFRAGHVDAVLTKDSFIALPKGIPHSWINTSTGQPRLITFTAGPATRDSSSRSELPGSGRRGLAQRCRWRRSTRERAVTASPTWRPPTIRWTVRSRSGPGAVPRSSARWRASGTMLLVPPTR
jgi:uncharacterized cupin superfamily protein